MSKERGSSHNIQAVILDIDGVIVGDLEGQNFPHPSQKVKKALLQIHDSGIPVSFLTGKPSFAAAKNVLDVGIDNFHVADGGATIFNPMQGTVAEVQTLDSARMVDLLDALPTGTYVNLFGLNEYYLQTDIRSAFTEPYTKIAGQDPKLVGDLREIATAEQIVKINIIAFSQREKEELFEAVKSLSDSISFEESGNPLTRGAFYILATPKGVSKRSGVEHLVKHFGVDLDSVLAAGDTMHDWGFMEVCGYKAAMGNAKPELKAKIDLRDPRQMIGGEVNNDGILDVFKHFDLIE